MDKKLLDAIYSLKEGINQDSRILKLEELDKKLNVNEEVMILSYRKDVALDKYNEAIKLFGENSEEASAKQKELYEAKLNLDNHPLVKEYNQAYKEVRKLYNEINKALFKDFFDKGDILDA